MPIILPAAGAAGGGSAPAAAVCGKPLRSIILYRVSPIELRTIAQQHSWIHSIRRAPRQFCGGYPFLSSGTAKILWGRLVTCGRLLIGPSGITYKCQHHLRPYRYAGQSATLRGPLCEGGSRAD